MKYSPFIPLLLLFVSCASNSSSSSKIIDHTKDNHICQIANKYPEASIVGGSGDLLYEQLELYYSQLSKSNEFAGVLFSKDSLGNLSGSIPSGLLFDFDKYELHPTHQLLLNEFARELLNTNSAPELTIIGHTDNIGREEYNLELSSRRAYAVRDYLQAHHPSIRIASALGAGEEQPVASNDTSDGRRKNRRVVIIINQ